MIIYCITNLINNKKYVGATTGKYRFREHLHSAEQENPIQLISRKIKQYGANNFKYEVLYDCKSLDEMYEKEMFYINKLNTYFYTGHGYNMTLGGKYNRGYKHTEDYKEDQSDKRTGISNTEESKKKCSISMKVIRKNTISSFTLPEVRVKLSEAAKLKVGSLNPNFKYSFTEDDLRSYYKDHSLKETTKHFKCSEATTVRRLKTHGISKNNL